MAFACMFDRAHGLNQCWNGFFILGHNAENYCWLETSLTGVCIVDDHLSDLVSCSIGFHCLFGLPLLSRLLALVVSSNT